MQHSSAQITWTTLRSYPDNEYVEASWREFLTQADFGAHYVSPEYFREPFLRDKRPFVILVWQGRRVVAALSGIHEGQEVLCGLRSRPQICFDKNVDLESASTALVNGLSNEMGSERLITFYSWVPFNSPTKHGYRCQQEEGVV